MSTPLAANESMNIHNRFRCCRVRNQMKEHSIHGALHRMHSKIRCILIPHMQGIRRIDTPQAVPINMNVHCKSINSAHCICDCCYSVASDPLHMGYQNAANLSVHSMQRTADRMLCHSIAYPAPTKAVMVVHAFVGCQGRGHAHLP